MRSKPWPQKIRLPMARPSTMSDHNKFFDCGLMFTPGLVINQKLVSFGRVPTINEIKSWIAEPMN